MAHRGGHDGSSPVYQIDFTALATGKRIASTKRRVRWRFGFTNQQALQNGETGTACRGEEHDVTLVWSITSGKRLVLADGQEVHYSVSRNNDFDCSWTMRGGHVLKLIAHASPPINAGASFRQYDFLIDGQSFFSMPKVYRLGLTSGRGGGGGRHTHHTPAHPPTSNNIAAIETPHNTQEEEAYLQEAIKQSLDSKPKEEAPPALPPSEPPKKDENLLLDLFDAPAPAPAAPLALPAPAPAQENGFGSSNPQPTLSAEASEDFGFSALAPAPATQPPPSALGASFTQPPPPARASFTQPPAPAPALTYGQPPAGTMGFAPPPQPAPAGSLGFASPSPQPAPAAQPVPAAPFDQSTGAVLSMNPPAPAPAATNADQAYQNIASMADFNLDSKANAPNTNPFGGAAAQPTLGEMKTMTGGGSQAPKQDVMNAPPAGAMVVSGQQTGNWGNYGVAGGQQMNQTPGQGLGGYGAAPGSGGYGSYGTQQQQQPQQYGQQQYGQQQQYGHQQQQPQQYQYQQQF